MLNIPDLQSFPYASLTAWSIELVAYKEFLNIRCPYTVNDFGE